MLAADVKQQPVVTLGAEGERLQFMGYEIVFKSPTPDLQEGWTVLEYTLPAHQAGAPLHYHKELTESFYVMEGSLWMRVNDHEVEAGPGSLVVVPPYTWHAFSNRSDAPAKFIAHASSAHHRDFLLKLFDLAKSAKQWPPADPTVMFELGRQHDSYYA